MKNFGDHKPITLTPSENFIHAINEAERKKKESRKGKLHIFLDINGVINNKGSVLEGVFFLPEKVKLINILLYDYNPVLVI